MRDDYGHDRVINVLTAAPGWFVWICCGGSRADETDWTFTKEPIIGWEIESVIYNRRGDIGRGLFKTPIIADEHTDIFDLGNPWAIEHPGGFYDSHSIPQTLDDMKARLIDRWKEQMDARDAGKRIARDAGD